jgi:N-acetylmuramic acid 6-phosphate etherase
MKSMKRFARLPTEQNNPRSRRIDRMPTARVLRLINREDAAIARAVAKTIPQIEKAVDNLVRSMKNGGRLFFFGAGTSGRFGIMEAAECPPTFNTAPSQIQAFMAGGRMSVFRSKEGAEDRGDAATLLVRKHVRPGDAVIGIAASGITPFVDAALRAARAKKAATVLVTCNPRHARKSPAQVTIAVATGPEVIAGSTRLKAGTATKLVLNMLTVATMVRIGKVFGNRMVDLQPRSAKLQARATRLIMDLAGVSLPRAAELLKLSGGNAKTAIVMAAQKIDRAQAVRRLQANDGHLYKSLQNARS